MALLYAEGFEVPIPAASATYYINSGYVSGGQGTNTSTRSAESAYCYRMNKSSGFFAYAQPSTSRYSFIGMALIAETYNTQNVQNLITIQANNAEFIRLTAVNGTATFNVYVIGTNRGTITLNSSWQYLEFESYIHNTLGYVNIYINSTLIASYTNIDTESGTFATGITYVYVSPAGAGATADSFWRLDDVYICDDQGPVANTRLGDIYVKTLSPNADSSIQFTRNTGATNASCVDDSYLTTNFDTDYNASSTVGHIDKFGLTDISISTLQTIHGVCASYFPRREGSQIRSTRLLFDVDGSVTNGATNSNILTTISMYPPTCLSTHDGTNAFTEAKVNSLLVGYEVVA